MAGRPGIGHAARRCYKGPAGERHNRRCRQCGCVHTANSYIVPFHLLNGGFGLYGPCSFHHGPPDAQDGPARQVVHPHADGIRMQRSCHNGHTYHREPQQPHNNHSCDTVHVVQCTPAGDGAVCRGILPRPRTVGADRALPARHCSGNNNRPSVAPHKIPQGRDSVCYGAATIPLAHAACHTAPHVGEVCTVCKEDWYRDTALDCCNMVPELLPKT